MRDEMMFDQKPDPCEHDVTRGTWIKIDDIMGEYCEGRVYAKVSGWYGDATLLGLRATIYGVTVDIQIKDVPDEDLQKINSVIQYMVPDVSDMTDYMDSEELSDIGCYRDDRNGVHAYSRY